jgi:threonine dehydratase
LVAASAGNHAQGVALAAKLLGLRATIVMPESTALIKVQRTEGYGAEVVLHGANWDQSQARAVELAHERDMTLVHPFDDAAVIEGQGTVGLEVLDDLPDVDTLVVPIGGGGLAAGVALAVKALRPSVRVVGVQAAGAAAMVKSLAAGAKVRVEQPTTIAEGIRVGNVGDATFEIVRALLDDCVTVSDDEISEAVVQMMEKICAIVSGGNIDLNLLARLIESGLANAGRYHLVRLRMADTPGNLHRAIGVIASSKGNIVDVQHYRAGWKVPVGFVDVEILVETRHARQGAELDDALRANGFEVRG